MGTRCLTKVYDESGAEIICLYRQYDGYPEDGHGDELRAFLDRKVIVNGIPLGKERDGMANGMECLAAQIVAHFKREDAPGRFYLYVPGTRGVGEEYIYHVRGKVGEKPTVTWEEVKP